MKLCQLSGIETILVNLSPGDDDTLSHKHRDRFKIWMFNGVKNQCFDVIQRQRALMYILCIYMLIIEYKGDLADQELCICFPSFVHISFEKTQKDFLLFLNNFVGIFIWKPSRDLTRPLGSPRGLKGLLHTLNAIVIPTTVSQVLRLVFILFCSRTSKRQVWGYFLGDKLSYFTCLFHPLLARIIT